jgi:hypothetical protein
LKQTNPLSPIAQGTFALSNQPVEILEKDAIALQTIIDMSDDFFEAINTANLNSSVNDWKSLEHLGPSFESEYV